MISVKYKSARRKKNLSSGYGGLLSPSRKLYNISTKTLEFSSSPNKKTEAKLSMRNRFTHHVSSNLCQKTNVFLQSSSGDTSDTTHVIKDTEKFYDNETIVISSLSVVPKAVSKPSTSSSTKKRQFFLRNTIALSPKTYRNTRGNSVASSTMRYSVFSEDVDTLSPLYQPKYKAFSQVVSFPLVR